MVFCGVVCAFDVASGPSEVQRAVIAATKSVDGKHRATPCWPVESGGGSDNEEGQEATPRGRLRPTCEFQELCSSSAEGSSAQALLDTIFPPAE